MDDNPSILSHVSIGTNQFERAVAFYDKVLPTLGCKRIMEHPGAVAYGTQIGFIAPTKEAVHAFHEAALAAGGIEDAVNETNCSSVLQPYRRSGRYFDGG